MYQWEVILKIFFDEKIFELPINGIISGLAHIFHSAFITPKTKYWCALAQDAEGNEYVPYTDYSAVEKIADENGTYETRWAQSECGYLKWVITLSLITTNQYRKKQTDSESNFALHGNGYNSYNKVWRISSGWKITYIKLFDQTVQLHWVQSWRLNKYWSNGRSFTLLNYLVDANSILHHFLRDPGSLYS